MNTNRIQINDISLRFAIEAVEDNNKINDGAWANWDDAEHVCDVYGIELDAESSAVINRAIQSNGTSLAADMQAVELSMFGQNFAGSFWDRAE